MSSRTNEGMWFRNTPHQYLLKSGKSFQQGRMQNNTQRKSIPTEFTYFKKLLYTWKSDTNDNMRIQQQCEFNSFFNSKNTMRGILTRLNFCCNHIIG